MPIIISDYLMPQHCLTLGKPQEVLVHLDLTSTTSHRKHTRSLHPSNSHNLVLANCLPENNSCNIDANLKDSSVATVSAHSHHLVRQLCAPWLEPLHDVFDCCVPISSLERSPHTIFGGRAL